MEVFLRTERLVLRRFGAADVDDLFELHNDPAVMRFLNGGAPISRATIERETLPAFAGSYARHPGFGVWAATEPASGVFLGWFAFGATARSSAEEAELGYRLRRACWGRGYATEGARALIRRGFTELGVRRVVAQTMAVNTASRRVLEKAGLTLVRTFHQEWPDPIAGTEHGEVEYALRKADWEQQVAAGGPGAEQA
jgi:RimJ/RimL family protein N-acetyltransferase